MSHFSGLDHAMGEFNSQSGPGILGRLEVASRFFDSRSRARNLAGFVQERVKASRVGGHLQLNCGYFEEVSRT
jgi:hypothetical protein